MTDLVRVAADRVITAAGLVHHGWVRVAGDRIVTVGTDDGSSGVADPADEQTCWFPGSTIVPGFVDVHCHGGGGAEFGSGDEQTALALAAHRRAGTTSLLASLPTLSADRLGTVLDALAPWVQSGELAGLHLEGPWLSSTFAGAHDRALLRPPVRDEVDSVLDAGRGTIRMVTVAPELPGGLEAVRAISGRGAVAAVGHTAATYAGTRAAVVAGARGATHLFNAMPSLLHRDPGPVLALLSDPSVFVEVICDGVHVAPEVVSWLFALLGPRLVLISDATAAAGAGDGVYTLGSQGIEVRDGVARLTGSMTIAGSTLTLSDAVRTAVSFGVSLVDAVYAATAAPAAYVGLGDVGVIAPGRRADLVVLGADLRVERVMRAGVWV